MGVQALKEILSKIDHPVFVEVVEYDWFVDPYPSVVWSTNGDFDDLSSTYAVETIGSGVNYDGYFVVNAHTGCGETVTYMFNLEKEVKP